MITRLMTSPMTIAALAMLCFIFWLLLTPAQADQSPGTEVVTAAERPDTTRMENRAEARASASASASTSTKSGFSLLYDAGRRLGNALR